jgi:sec-independent protein translocase protein TatA
MSHPFLLFLDVGGGELLLILIAVFLLFGPKKFPELARGIGKGMYQIKKATRGITDEFEKGKEAIEKELEEKEIEANELKETEEEKNSKNN